jgi:hypothetical protein
MTKIAGSGSISQRHGSADPDPPQNFMDPEHWYELQQRGNGATGRGGGMTTEQKYECPRKNQT